MSDSGTTYGLTLAVLGKTPLIELTRDEFESAKRARELLVGVLMLEEDLNLVLANYVEYEAELLEGALHWLVFRPESWSDFSAQIHEVNRRVGNLLSACRGYLDHTRHFVSCTFGKDSMEWKDFKAWTAEEYDSSLGYRAMEELRSFAQHRGLAVHHLGHDNWSDGVGPGSVLRNALVPSIQPKLLAEQGNFKPSVLQELLDEGETVDLRPLVREYVVGILRAHDKLRTLLEGRVADADEEVQELIDRYKQEGQASAVGLVAAELDPLGQRVHEVPLFDDPIKRRKSLELRRRRAPSLSKVYTTNEPNPRRSN